MKRLSSEEARQHHSEGQRRRYARAIDTIEERFWSKVRKTESCWLWIGGTTKAGYGVFAMRTPDDPLHPFQDGAHRVAYQLLIGPVPEGLLVCHHCDVRLCVRPDHLFVGTYKDNTQDMIAKRRQGWLTHPESWRGERHHNVLLTERQVLEARRLFGKGERIADLAQRFGLSQSGMSKAVHRISWSHLQ